MITSRGNQQVKKIVQLQKNKSLRRQQDVFVAEGRKMFSEAEPAQIVGAFVSESFLSRREQAALIREKQAAGVPVEEVSDNVMRAMSDTVTPQGVLCVIKQRHYRLADMLAPKSPRLLMLEDVRDPGNLGTMLRTAEGAGIGGVLLTKDCVDIYNPKTIRATMGSLYRVPFLYMEEVGGVFDALRQRGLPVYAAALKESVSVSYETVSYKNGCVFLIGNEANGLSEEMIGRADGCVHIPMEGRVESLNASTAAAVLMYEAYRQTRT